MFESQQSSITPTDELQHDKNIVNEIIFNRIDDKYHLYTISIRDPVELLAKFKEIKKNEYKIASIYVAKSDDEASNVFEKFIVDSGATDQLA